MRKRVLSVTAAYLLLSNLGCTGSPTPSEPQALSKTSTSGPSTSGVAPAPDRFVPGQPTNDGLVRPPSGMGKAGRRPAPNPASYVNEVESANYLVSQNKTRIVNGYMPGYQSKNGRAQGYVGYDPGRAVAKPDAPASGDYKVAIDDPLSTFSADVDTASYANLRRSLSEGRRPDPEAVRVEEMINYFSYQLPEPKVGQPFSLTSEISDCPWNKDAQLLRLAIKTKSIPRDNKPPCNLVFLLDVSGSMQSPDKLPLLKSSLKTLLDSLDDADRIAIVTYAGASGLALPSTPASDKAKILQAIDRLEAGGSTNGASGIELAYQVAAQNEGENSVNRVILATDGDFNVGVSSEHGLKELIEEKRKSGIFLSVLGFGSDGYNDATMETLADNGNGNYSSIDSISEARKVLVEESGANLVTVAKDVKFQIDFNPKRVDRYRLLGYKNRVLANEDFANDKKDAGDLGAGHAVTVLYEVIPAKGGSLDAFSDAVHQATGTTRERLALVKLRYKTPSDDESSLLEIPVQPDCEPLAETSSDHRWAVAITSLGLSLDGDAAASKISLDEVMNLAESAVGASSDTYRTEFLELVKKAKLLPPQG